MSLKINIIKNWFMQNRLIFALTSIFIIIYLPLSLKINFYQNDDWYYYSQVELFLQGKFKLLNDIAPTFYAQGFLGALFSHFFGVSNLPILTLLISGVCVFVFLIILKINKISNSLVIVSFFIFISFPVFSYSILGFMTENYFLFFCLLSVLFFNYFIKNNKLNYFYLSLLFTLLAFFVKQNGIALFLVYSIYFFYIKHYKLFFISALSFSLTLLFYNFIFPQTFEMRENKFSYMPFLPLNLFYVIYTTLGYFLILCLPFFAFAKLNFKNIKFYKKTILKIVIILILSIGVIIQWYFYSKFKLYPYFGNTFSYLGYLYGSIDGSKPAFKIIPTAFVIYTNLAPIIIFLFLSYWIFKYRIIFKNKIAFFYFLAFLVFSFFNLSISHFYDRYLILPFILFVLLLANVLHKDTYKIILFPLIGVLLFNLYTTLIFSYEFVITNNYAWQQTINLLRNTKIQNDQICGNGAYNEKYNVKGLQNCKYYISWERAENVDTNYTLISIYKFDILSYFVKNPVMHIYKTNIK